MSRYRHSIVMQGNSKLLVHGGFDPEYISQPLDTMFSLDLTAFLSSKPQQPFVENEVNKAQEQVASKLQEQVASKLQERNSNVKMGLREIGES